MNKSASFAIAAVAASATSLCLAEAPVFAAPFTSHAVLQRDCPLPVWGTAMPGSTVAVALDGQRLSATADGKSGRWRVTFPAQREPGLGHTLTATGPDGESTTLEDIAIGDVWLCSGQSNMDMNYGWRLTRGKEDIEATDDPMMRLFDDHNAAALAPCDDLLVPTAWTHSGFEHAKTFSACGWFFGQALRKAMPDVPIGLVEASWSGSPIKTWISRDAYRGISPELAAEHDNSVASATKTANEFEAAGGKAGLKDRIALWEAECMAKGDIAAEGTDYDDSAWKTVSLPITFEKHIDKDFDGCVWYRRAIDLAAGQATGEATLNLGIIDDEDVTWINGVKVGANTSYDVQRSYKVPAGTLREGRNVIAVKATDWKIGGGLMSSPEKLALSLSDGSTVALAGEWRYEAFRFDPKPKDGSVNCWTPSACYNAMLHPLFPMALKGAIWYQGCSDVGGGGALYERKFRAMAADWREHFTHPDGMPIYIVQLAAFQQTHEKPFDSKWAEMRWAHMRLGETLAKSGTAVAIDVGDHADIHPKDKKTVGERLARLALARAYGLDGVVEAGPIPQSATLGGGAVSVTFRNAGGLSTSDGGAVSGFQLVAADGQAIWAEASISGEAVSVAVPEGFAPVKVRFAWDDYPVCNLVNGEGLPCGPFELKAVEAKRFPAYLQTFEVEFATAEEAATAECSITPLPGGAELAFGCRWDDTNPMHLDKAAMMERAGVKGSFYICPKDTEFFWTGLRKLMDGGHAIGNHTLGHPDLFTINLNEGFRAIAEGRVAIETTIQHPVTSFVAPYGWGDNPLDAEHRPTLLASIVATGHFVTQDNPYSWGKGPPDVIAFMPCWRFSADDRNPSRELFEDGFRKMLDKATASSDIPRLGLGTHSWCNADGNALQEALLKEHCLNPDWAQLNDWEYGAYRYEALHGSVRKVSVDGNRAVFEAMRFFPAWTGDTIPLSLRFTGAEPLHIRAADVELSRGERGTWTLPHAMNAGRLHDRIVRADADGLCEGIAGLRVSVEPDETAGLLRVSVENRTGDELRRLRVVAAFPPKWSSRGAVAEEVALPDGAMHDFTLEMGKIARRDYAFGSAYYPVSVDFEADDGLFRVWSEKRMPRVEVPETAPSRAARVWGPADATALADVDWGAASIPGAPLPDEANWRTPKSSPDSIWSVVDERRGVHGSAGAEVRALAANPAQGRFVVYEFDLPEAQTLLLRTTVGATRRNAALWVNGEKVPFKGPKQTFEAQKGRNRIILRADLVCVNDWWTDTLHIAVTGIDGFSEIY